MNKTTITFHSGLDSIGGVIMEVHYGDCRVFFEAGTAYDPAFDIFDGKVKTRKNIIKDLLWIGQIPKIDGIYSKRYIEEIAGLLPAEGYPIRDQAFFISHLHLDHMRMMGLISPSVKVYLKESAQTIERALEDVGMGIEDLRDHRYEDLKEETVIGEIRIHTFVLNSDSYQDLSFFIETPDLKIHFTGDVFLYGKYRTGILKELSFLQEHKPDLLVCEGTRFFKGQSYDGIVPSFEPKDGLIRKDELDTRIIGSIRKHPSLVLFNIYEREMSDVADYMRFAQETGREIVFEPETAHIINRFFKKTVKVLLPDSHLHEIACLDEILSVNEVVTKEEILADPKRYLLQNSYPRSLELLDYRNINALYLHHSGTPLGSFDPHYRNLMNIISLSKVSYQKTYDYEDGYFSPHAENYQILAYCEMVGPSLVIPCHSENREAMLSNLTLPSFYARKGVTYSYDRGMNILKETDDD
jgi:ribonuclease J